MNKIILTDVDEVVLRWGPAFESWLLSTRRFYPEKPLEHSYNIEEWLGISKDYTHELIMEFNTHEDRFPYLQPYEDAVRNIPKLKSNGYSFIAISACGNTPSINDQRKKNIDYFFPDTFTEIHCVDVGGSKNEVLSSYSPTYWIEDSGRNATEGAKIGHKSFLINRTYNLNEFHPLVMRVQSWDSIHRYIELDNI